MFLIRIFILLLFIPFCVFAEEDIKVVEVAPAVKGTIRKTVRLIGVVKPKNSTVLTANVSGVIDSILPVGTKVLKGDVIAKLENENLSKNLKLSEDAVYTARKTYERSEMLYAKKLVTRKTLDDDKHNLINAEQKYSAAKIEYDNTTFRAPFNGIVGSHKIRAGTHIQQGSEILTFYAPENLLVEFDIPENQVPFVNLGSKVIINEKEFQVTEVQKVIDHNTHMAPANADFNCETCVIGSSIDVDLVINEQSGLIIIPADAVFLKDGSTKVYIVEKDTVQIKEIITGLREKQKIEIKSGLVEGEQVIIRGQSRLRQEMKVQIHKENN